MTEMTWTTFVIGGPIGKLAADELDNFLHGSDTDDNTDAAIVEVRPFVIQGNRNFGNDDALEDFLQKQRLTWKKSWCAAGEFSAGVELHRPDEETIEFRADEDGGVLISKHELRKAALASMSIADILTKVALFDTVPPLTFVDKPRFKVTIVESVRHQVEVEASDYDAAEKEAIAIIKDAAGSPYFVAVDERTINEIVRI